MTKRKSELNLVFSTPIWKVELPLDNDVLIKKIKELSK